MDKTVEMLSKAPIIEAILDIDCEFNGVFCLEAKEANFREALRDSYPKLRKKIQQQIKIVSDPKATITQTSQKPIIEALQFVSKDERQLVQSRVNGYTFNRLAPYETLDSYMDEISRTWNLFCEIAEPIKVTSVRLRYLNKLMLPMTGNACQLDEYLVSAPHLPGKDEFALTGFFAQRTAREIATNNEITIVVGAQPPEEQFLPIILDICASSSKQYTTDWKDVLPVIMQLKSTTLRVFLQSVTESCLNLYQ